MLDRRRPAGPLFWLFSLPQTDMGYLGTKPSLSRGPVLMPLITEDRVCDGFEHTLTQFPAWEAALSTLHSGLRVFKSQQDTCSWRVSQSGLAHVSTSYQEMFVHDERAVVRYHFTWAKTAEKYMFVQPWTVSGRRESVSSEWGAGRPEDGDACFTYAVLHLWGLSHGQVSLPVRQKTLNSFRAARV